jgi:glycosyltransferase involved in cell wall biosynthesis
MKLYIALPAINELEYIGSTIDCIRKQKGCPEFEVFVCVNQPEQSSGTSQQDSAENEIYLNNQRTLEYLRSVKDIPLTVIDRSSKGKGWKGKEGGVGWARKITIDAIVARVIKTKQEKFHAEDAEEIAKDTEIKSRFRLYEGEDIIISLDADTVFGEKYFASIADVFSGNPDAVGLSVPYYHQLTEDDVLNRAILRYEIYMRHYMINLLRIGSPYSFTALGSAIALPVKACRAIGGLTPKKSGEDFYFLQKLCKFGKVMINNDERVEPAARFSDRVFLAQDRL